MLLHPDPDEPQLLCIDPTQYRYELIRPLLLFPDRSATQRAQETGTHPETVGRLKRRFVQQGMLGLGPAPLDILPARLSFFRINATGLTKLQRHTADPAAEKTRLRAFILRLG